MLSTVLLHILTHLILTSTVWARYKSYPHFPDKKTEALGNFLTNQ